MNEIFSEKIKKLRLTKGLTQEQLAKLVYVSRSAVAKWEQNRGFPNIEALQKMSEIFEVSIDDLLSDKELEIIKVMNSKKISIQRKIIIVLSVFMSIILLLFITLAIVYHPRTISKYIDCNENTFNKIEIENHDETTLRIDEAEELLNEILNIKVIPSYLFVKKTVTSYTIYIYYETDTYQINGNYIYDGENRTYFNVVNCNFYDLVNEYIQRLDDHF